LETWAELLGFLPRLSLVQLITQIRDRKFASILEFFLIKCGKITLEWIHIKPSWDIYGPAIVQKNKDLFTTVDLPLANKPIPPNVKNFKGIRLRFDCIIIKFNLSQDSAILILPY
jgi:hypothetical protein